MDTNVSSSYATRRAVRAAARRGFTLIEVMLVIVIIGMLATVLIFAVGGRSNEQAIKTTTLSIQKLGTRVEEFLLNASGTYPPDLDALVKKPADEKLSKGWVKLAEPAELNDAWGNKFEYELLDAGAITTGEKRYKIWSKGPDGQSGNEDDIKNWTEGT